MGYIKEPKNVSFHVIPIDYTEEEQKITSEAIKKYKQRISKRKKIQST